ncbi:MAG: hypothetical protein ACLGI6_06230 [Gammaproteobacteria bacterium]
MNHCRFEVSRVSSATGQWVISLASQVRRSNTGSGGESMIWSRSSASRRALSFFGIGYCAAGSGWNSSELGTISPGAAVLSCACCCSRR